MKFLLILIGFIPCYFFSGFVYQVPTYQPVFSYPPDFEQEYLNDLSELVQQAQQPDSLRWEILWDLSYYTHTRNLTRALTFADMGLEEAKSEKNSLWEGRFQLIKGAILLRMDEPDQAELYLRSAQNKVNNSDLWLLYTNLGYVYERRGDISMAFEWAKKTLDLGLATADLKAQAMAYSDISYLFWKQGKFETGLNYGLKSLELFRNRGVDDLDFDFTHYVVGNNYLALSQLDQAESHFLQSIAMGERFGFYNNLSDAYISLVSLYILKKDFTAAKKAGSKALNYATLLDNKFMQMRSLLGLGEVAIARGNFKEAENHLLSSIEVAGEDFGDHYFLSQAYENLSEVYEKTGAADKALTAFKTYHRLNQTIFNQETEQKTAALMSALDLAQKENTIKQQAFNLAQQKKRSTYWFVGSILLLVFFLLLFRGYRIIKKKNNLLEIQNKEKTFLVRETHHRIKNNLQVVSSLLSLQSERITDPEMQQIMIESQNRVQSMGLVHQKLYQGKNLACIEMRDYFSKLGEDIIFSFGALEKVTLKCDMEPIELDIITAIPIGLIINELITNSLKYAFPNLSSGQITIYLERTDPTLTLHYMDNGIGFEEKNPDTPTGFGAQLIQLLTAQLDGQIRKLNHEGTYYLLNFQNVNQPVFS
ncbi:histidine kinase dimerization/phosphoacceptor domain -containing protein [Cyclobacterium sp. SYSU L10401]|uniref:histidine kinase dimerization/phosphoacceptor domain -containing protein n=1 Tax=Cyclobacterium sp. SYSU L10401 TaxID=2678657 RepID=UPI0013D45ACA|nr:histidine kinase dimerization/phosphoacceptor domain -containing protein [Cyclobacterium sp. SYSU L10401]